MILSRNWLNEYVDVSDISDRDFAEGMTISGSKVEITEDLGAEITKVVIGRVLTMEKHPNSDHMYITTIDVGEEAPATVVTGPVTHGHGGTPCAELQAAVGIELNVGQTLVVSRGLGRRTIGVNVYIKPVVARGQRQHRSTQTAQYN